MKRKRGTKKRRRNITRRQAKIYAKRRKRDAKGHFLPGPVPGKKVGKRKRRKARRKSAKRRVVARKSVRRTRRRSPRRLVVKRRGPRSVTVRAANPRKRRKSRRLRTKRLSGRRVRVSLRNPRRTRRYRRRNPMSMSLATVKSSAKSLIAREAMGTYLTIGGGFIAGAILPRFVGKLLMKIPGIDKLPPTVIEVGIGVASSVLAGIGVQVATGKRDRAIQAAGGALVGALGALALGVVDKYVPMQGLGESAADAAVRSAVEAQVQKELGMSGMGDFLTEASVEDDLAMQGMGDFVTTSEVESAGTVSGGVFGAEADLDIEESAEFDFD